MGNLASGLRRRPRRDKARQPKAMMAGPSVENKVCYSPRSVLLHLCWTWLRFLPCADGGRRICHLGKANRGWDRTLPASQPATSTSWHLP